MPSKKRARATQSEAKTLVIVESPTKAKTISQFVGEEYDIESSYGHLRDLPKSKLGIDVEHNFEPQYVIPRKVQSRVTALKKLAAKAAAVVLATDEDREGEAIAWHLLQVLNLNDGKKPVRRIVFHEITKTAILHALENPRSLDMALVNAQQARRVLDRLVGYKLSPFLWKKVASGLSAGRVQSVALRLIVDREEEIKAFKPEVYFTITAKLESAEAKERQAFEASLLKIDGEAVPKLSIITKEAAERIAHDFKKSSLKILSVERKETRKNPNPSFITSTLQQTAAQRLGFSSKKTMFLAQSLYENGLITYMRTDSVHISREALASAQSWIGANLPREYAVTEPRMFKTKSRLAQEAHEAIRPTHVEKEPKSITLEKDPARLYDLIWRRFLASQLPPAVFDATRIEIDAAAENASRYLLATNGNILKFDGYLKLWPTKFEARELPPLRENEKLNLLEALAEEHATEPPPRYNEASLIKTLEKYGIGRPSTYAPIISVIQDRNYVEKNQGRFCPTEVGSLVNRVITENFPDVVNIDFTAKMEEQLDAVAEGKEEWQKSIKEFYEPFAKLLEIKYEEVSKKELLHETTDEVCEKCGKPMMIKFGRFGKFMACSGFPDCKTTKTLKSAQKSTGFICPKCDKGEIIERRVNKKGRSRGRIFWGCSRYPDCDHATWTNPLGEKKEVDTPKPTEAAEQGIDKEA